MAAPNLILPIMVLNVLGAEQAAYYYIAYAIAALLFMIPNAISMSLFVEGSHGEALKRTVVKSLVTIFSLLVPAAAVLYLCCERGCRPLYPCIRRSLRSVGLCWGSVRVAGCSGWSVLSMRLAGWGCCG